MIWWNGKSDYQNLKNTAIVYTSTEEDWPLKELETKITVYNLLPKTLGTIFSVSTPDKTVREYWKGGFSN